LANILKLICFLVERGRGAFVTFMISLRRIQMFLLTYLLTYLLLQTNSKSYYDMRGTAVERWSFANFPCPALNLKLTGDYLCGQTVSYWSAN